MRHPGSTLPQTRTMRPSRESGASLVIVLAMICIFGLMVGALATRAQVGVMSNSGVRKERVDQYAASGAIDSAISYLRGNRTLRTPGPVVPAGHDELGRRADLGRVHAGRRKRRRAAVGRTRRGTRS